MVRNQRAGRTGVRSTERTAGDQPAPGGPGPVDQEDETEAPADLADELLIDGQEEVFSRTEVESGRFEHHVGEERAVPVSPSGPTTAEQEPWGRAMDSDLMPHPLQEKDAQWRRRGHDARPIFDPGMAPAGADEEAGGARSVVPADDGPSDPLPTEPVFQPGGPRLTPRFWYGCAAAVGVLMLVFGLLSL